MDLINFLNKKRFIVLLDHPSPKSYYKVSKHCVTKSSEDLAAEFKVFLNTVELPSTRSNLISSCLSSEGEEIEDFFYHLSRRQTLGETTDLLDNPPLCFFLWIFGVYSGYIERLFEFHMQVIQIAHSKHAVAMVQHPVLYSKLSRFDGNVARDEILIETGASEEEYDSFVETLGLKRLLLVWSLD